jgi:hypothetical protein
MDSELQTIELLAEFAGIFRATRLGTYELTEYECLRNAKSGAVQKVQVRIYDAGPNRSHAAVRYAAEAVSEDGKRTSRHSGPSGRIVLATLNWSELDG